MQKKIPENQMAAFMKAIDGINGSHILVEGNEVNPAACYHLETEPLSVLFNTNCPETLKLALEKLISRFGVSVDQEAGRVG